MRLPKGVFVIFSLPCAVSSWIASSTLSQQELVRRKTSLSSSNTSPQDAENLRDQAKKLREEIDSFEQEKIVAEQESRRQQEEEQTITQAKRERYSAAVPILKPDGSEVEERCDFLPRWKEEDFSFITVVEAELPLGIILGESDLFPGAISIDEIGDDSNGAKAGLQVNDLLRACTACRMEMDRPAWQLIAGGIGRPKTVRFMYSADNRPFEEVVDAVSSNRMDPKARPVLLVIERREA